MAKGEGSSHAPESKSDFAGERQRHQMGENRGVMKGGDFGVGEYPGRAKISHAEPNAKMLTDAERGCAPCVHMGANKMAAAAMPDHGPHHHRYGK